MTTPVNGWPQSCTRVVFFAPRTAETSGGARVVQTLSTALQAHGVAVEHISLLGPRPSGFPTFVVNRRPEWHRRSSFREAAGLGARVRGLAEVAAKRLDRALNRRRLRRHLARLGPETALVFTHVSTKMAADESGWVRDESGPVLIGQHHSQFESIDLEEWLRAAMMRHFQDIDVFVALTPEDASRFQEILGPPCLAVPNPVDPPTAHPRERRSLAVAVSRLSGEKAIEVMIRCFASATSGTDLQHWSLDIHGEGDQHDRLQAEVRATGATNIRLVGPSDDVYDVLAEASVLLLTSWMEGLPMSVLEAAVMGVPTIAVDCSPGVRSLVGDDRGVLVPPGDEEAYTRALAAALRQPEELRHMGLAAQTFAAGYSPDAVLGTWADVVALAQDLGADRAR